MYRPMLNSSKTFIMIVMLLYSLTAIAQRYKPMSYDEYAAPFIAYKQAFDRANNQIDQLQTIIINALAEDIDDKLRSNLNYEYQKLSSISQKLHSDGLYANIWKEINNIQTSITNSIIDYNNRVAAEKAKREQLARETERKRVAEEAKKQQKPTNWSGTGFALNSGYLVTNYHVIDGAKDIVVKGVKGNFNTAYHADVVASDRTNDLAILKINDSAFKGFGAVPYRIRSSMVDVGSYVWTLGYPITAVMGDEIKYTDGKINSKSGIQGDLSVYQMSIPIQPGNSGSPVFDKSGYVVGIASSGLNREAFNSENVNYAIKSNYLRMLVESTLSSNIFPNGTALQGISNTEQIKLAKNFVYLIQCSNRANGSQSAISTNDFPTSDNSSMASNCRTILRPSVSAHFSTASGHDTKIEKIVIAKNYTAVTITTINSYDEGYYRWCSISPNTYISVDVSHYYTMTKAEGIAITPEKTYFSKKDEILYFTLYFPAIPNDATKIDLVEPGDSDWKWYGIDISGK